MDARIRPIREEETDEFVYINAYGFDRDRTPEALAEAAALERELYPPESKVAAFLDGRMVARMHVFPAGVYLNGGVVPMGAVGGVAVLPEHRRRGLTAALLQYALNEMRDRGQAVSALYPMHYDLYRRYGWEVVSDSVRYSFPPRRARVARCAAGQCRRAGSDEWPALDAVYARYAARHNGCLTREERWWRETVLGGGRDVRDLALWESDGAVTGYVVYRSRHFAVPERYQPMSILQVRELVALDGDSYAGLLGFVLHHDLHDRVDWPSSRQEPLPYVIDDASKVKVENGWPQLALRLVDVRRALEARPCLPIAEGCQLTIGVRDAAAGWNEGAWRLEAFEGRARVEPTAAEPDLTVEVGTLAAVYAGRLPVGEAARAGLVEVRDERALEVASSFFAVSSPFHCLDWF